MKIFSWQSEQGCRILIDHLQDGIFVMEEGKMIYANLRLAKMLGYKLEDLIGCSFIGLVAPVDQPIVMERYRARLNGEEVPAQYDIRLLTARGSLIFCSLNVGLIEAQKDYVVTIGSARDVTMKMAELAELESSQLELQSIFDQLPDVFYRTDMRGIITMISPSCYEVLGYRQELMLGTAMAVYYQNPEDRLKVVQAISDGGGKATRVEAGLRHKDGSIRWISSNAFVRYGADGQPIYIEGVARDISERKQMEDQLIALSRTDVLTEVFSRRYFMDKSEAVIEMMRRYQHQASMMMIDLDHFKKINDKYGHYVGDLALIAFTKACRQEIRDSDIFGRLGGEEFGLMLPETPIQNAQILAERIRIAAAAIEIPVGDNIIGFTISIGLVELRAQDQSLDSIMRRADHAMYQAKEMGRNQVVTALEIA